jgi:DNA topoisomerase-1
LSKNLIIVESPAKAKTIKNFLGKDYEVIASKGHLRDLPKTSFGIKIEDDNFKPEYRVTKDHSDIAKKIKDLAKKAETIYIATDEDREGEAIGYHIAYLISSGKKLESYPRIVFHEITKTAIKKALDNPRKLDLNSVNAQQTRRLLDRIVGYKLSPLLGQKIQRGLSAGRVQSSALKIIVDREREIKAFIPEEYHTITAQFKSADSSLVEFNSTKIEKLTIKNQAQADEILNTINNESFKVQSIESKQRKTSSPAPFMTSTLQQTASTMLGFSPRKTMQVAQKLYEGVKTPKGEMGVITYMRTDSLNLAAEAVDAAIEYIENEYGIKYSKKTFYKSKSQGAQEAHEAIRPTNVDLTPNIMEKYLTKDEFRLYSLIFNRFLASQMTEAIFDTQSIIFSSQSSKFKANGRKLAFDGFYKVYGSSDKDKLLPEFEVEEEVDIQNLKSTQNFTEPPSRYSEASLVKKLESLGIGRPSTYAPTITLLQNREYVTTEKKQLIPTEIAFKVTEVLEKHFSNIVDSSFTANMEDTLDLIADGKKEWQEILKEFYNPFMDLIAKGKKEIPSQKIAKPIDEFCPECGEQLLIRKGRFGEFIACSAYPKCKYTRPMEGTKEDIKTDEKCEKCGSEMVKKRGKNGEFLACSNYPDCKNTKSLAQEKAEPIDVKCPECQGKLLKRNSRRGAFYGCENYPDCKFISKFLPTEKKCPECDYVMAERVYRKKDVYECIKCKTRVDKES